MKLLSMLVASINSLFAPAAGSETRVPELCSQVCTAETCSEQELPASAVIIVGTDRPDSNTSVVAEQLHEAYQKAGIVTQFFKVSDFGPELYAPSAYAQRPALFQQCNDAIITSDVVVLVTPEYNATVPAPLTRVINLLSYPDSFEEKKFVIVTVSVSPYGGARAHEQLKKNLLDLHAIIDEGVNLKIPHVNAQTKGAQMYQMHAESVAAFAQQ